LIPFSEGIVMAFLRSSTARWCIANCAMSFAFWSRDPCLNQSFAYPYEAEAIQKCIKELSQVSNRHWLKKCRSTILPHLRY
jgi:hypothetical protein